MTDPTENKKNDIEKKLEVENDYQKNKISNSYLSSLQMGFTITYNIKRKIEELSLNGQKEIDIEIKGSKEEPTGISFELFNFDKTKNNEFYDQNIEYIKNSFVIQSLNLELKEEEDFSTIKKIFDFFKEIVSILPNDFFKIRTLFRKKGKTISFDLIHDNENYKNDKINDDPFNNYLNIGIKTGINLKDIFSENPDHFKNLINALSAIFNFKVKGMYTNYIILYILEFIKKIKFRNETLVNRLEKINEFINGIIIAFFKIEFKLEYDNINLANEIKKEICLLYGENNIDKFQKIVQEYINKVKNGIKNILLSNNFLLDLLKKINLDLFSLSFVSSLIQSGFIIIFKIPGLYDFISNMK